MRRADRLFQIVQHLRGGRLTTAQSLADALEVSPRTIYRDIADLQGSGVPVEGEAGVGYVMAAGFEMPPLMFTRAEVVALKAGAELVRGWGGAGMARAAEEALVKIGAILPDQLRVAAEATSVHAIARGMTPEIRERIDQLEQAAADRTRLRLTYTDQYGVGTERPVRPLGLWFFGKVWTLVAWCELREDFRMFRIDRISEAVADGRFRAERDKSLAAMRLRIEAEGGSPASRSCP